MSTFIPSPLLLRALVGAASVLMLVSVLNAQQVTLTSSEQFGKSIFFDQRLSINGNQSCASCHAPETGWTGPDSLINSFGAVYEGSIPGRFGDRRPPSAAYATQSPIFQLDKKGLFVGGNFWDGRATGEILGNPAADQAQHPFLNPVEQALPDFACVVYLVCTATEEDGYPISFEEVWGAGACDIDWPDDIIEVCATEGATVDLSAEDRYKAMMAFDNIALSVASYESSPEVNAFTSKFDYSRRGRARLTLQEHRGFSLFMGKGKCAKCHPANGLLPLFTDFSYDNLGVPANPDRPHPAFVDLGLGGFLESLDSPLAAENYGKHKVPTLRNVDLRPNGTFVKAYMHNGVFKSLKEVVHFYNTRDVGDWAAPEVPLNVNTDELGDLGLTDEEEDAIVAFLKTLSDGYTP